MFDREAMIAGYDAQRDRMVDLVRSLRPEDLDKPTACEPWTVRDLVAHMTNSASTVQMLMERHIAKAPNPGLAALNERNAQGVASRQGRSVQDLLDELLGWHDKNVAYLRGLSDEQLASENVLVSGESIPSAQRFINAGLHYAEHTDQLRKATGRE
ncbi:MAG TPA: maleylpyruvate isomerase N-terminal domain-containing protein [Chloroflexota bacterium]|nr:maleylpyruvate isomerase N-terminal domain-containing protein [Chloroflexota bacterium]